MKYNKYMYNCFSKEVETVIHSADAFAPVGYLHLKNIHTKEKNIVRNNKKY